jgi:hypothetical protein
LGNLKSICSCGTPICSPMAMRIHRSANVWHRVARTARALRKHGVSYGEIARHVATNKMTVYLALKKEGL